jgi:hypothetical protein
MAALRYLLFIAIGIAVASLLFVALNVIVKANMEAGTGVIERWIVRATCDQYELTGTVRDTTGRPVAFAVVEATYLDERLSTRSEGDGRFALKAAEAVCNRRTPASVSLLVMADDFRPKRQEVPFDAGTLEVTLDAREFRP